jgi:hypothetical protein
MILVLIMYWMELVILHGLGQDSNSWNEVKEELDNLNLL